MAASRFSIFALCLLSFCVYAQHQKNIEVESQVDDCFSFDNIAIDEGKELVLLNGRINLKAANANCPCKSAVMKYSAFQKKDGSSFNLLSGQFSILGKKSVTLPIAVQKQLIFPDMPIYLSLSCSDNL